MGRRKKISNLAENGANRLESIKSGPNLVSDQKVDFLKNRVSQLGALPDYGFPLAGPGLLVPV